MGKKRIKQKTHPFYERCVDAVMIEDDSLGVYKRMIEIE